MIERVPEDILYGAYAVFAAWGWADAEIIELEPAERMQLRAYSYYEGDGAIKAGINSPFAFMIRGVSAAFMDLAYGGPYPQGARHIQVHADPRNRDARPIRRVPGDKDPVTADLPVCHYGRFGRLEGLLYKKPLRANVLWRRHENPEESSAKGLVSCLSP